LPKHIAMFTLIFVHLSEYLYELYHVEKLLRRDMELDRMLEFVRYAHPTKLGNYSGRNVDYILRLLYDDDDAASTSQDNQSLLTSSAADTTHLEPDDEQGSTSQDNQSLLTSSAADTTHLEPDDEQASTLQDNTSLLTSSAADTTYLEPDDEQESTRNIAHGLHFASIAMLGLLVLEVSRHFSLVT